MTQSRKIILASLAAVGVALAILFTAVLPAEYGWDPLGTGAALGLVGMSDKSLDPLHSQQQGWRHDSIEFQLAPFEGVEYKYHLNRGAALLYRWEADGEVLFDMHSEPEGAAPGYAESFAKSRSTGDTGNYTAPFTGIHGWFWQNRGQTDMTVSLETEGFYDYAMEMTEGRMRRVDFTDAVDD
jgi:hypothetical protein